MPKSTREVFVHHKGNDYFHVRLHVEPVSHVVHSADSNNPAILLEALAQCSQIISNALKRLRDEHVG